MMWESIMNFKFTESVVEEACLQYFGQLKYDYLPAPEIACDGASMKFPSGEIRVDNLMTRGKN